MAEDLGTLMVGLGTEYRLVEGEPGGVNRVFPAVSILSVTSQAGQPDIPS